MYPVFLHSSFPYTLAPIPQPYPTPIFTTCYPQAPYFPPPGYFPCVFPPPIYPTIVPPALVIRVISPPPQIHSLSGLSLPFVTDSCLENQPQKLLITPSPKTWSFEPLSIEAKNAIFLKVIQSIGDGFSTNPSIPREIENIFPELLPETESPKDAFMIHLLS